MINKRLFRFIEQLCRQGEISRVCPGDLEAELMSALDDLGIEVELTEQGLKIQFPYRLIELEHLQQESELEDFEWIYNLITESTNIDAIAAFERSGKQNIALCECQTRGKGRRGNVWISPFAKNIYCTIGLLKTINPEQLGLISIVTGIALCDALKNSGIDDIKVKWPNDLMYRDKKLGGILIESRQVAGDQYFLAIGFGLNVLMTSQDLSTIPQAATSLNLISEQIQSRQTILNKLIDLVIHRIGDFNELSADQLIQSFSRHDAFFDRSLCVRTSAGKLSGKNAGINVFGQLQLDTGTGLEVFSAADISLRADI